ncbi:MAG: hypothetical protein H0V04_00345 [Chloroflexi bacterium]|nr:hypothetical protein [Chloroflexota bacterium]
MAPASRLHLLRLAIAAVLLVAIAGCGGTSGGASPAGSGSITEVPVRMTDALRYEPSPISVPAGTVRFVVTNAGTAEHEFYVGDEAAQAEHEEEMRSMGGMAHDDPNGISVKPGETKTLEITFEAGVDTLVGCHVPGHYAGGMKSDIDVTP